MVTIAFLFLASFVVGAILSFFEHPCLWSLKLFISLVFYANYSTPVMHKDVAIFNVIIIICIYNDILVIFEVIHTVFIISVILVIGFYHGYSCATVLPFHTTLIHAI